MDEHVMQSFKELLIWQRSMGLVEGCYVLVEQLPKDEMYGLSSQVRRAAVSIPANIAEGHGRESTGAFIQFLRIAQGSLKELETHLIFLVRLRLANEGHVAPLLTECSEIGKMIRALIRSLQAKLDGEPQ